ncbi:MAG TPA: hypothetical protein VEX60_02220 [Pyrinomonadaceae bacterium]|nr:hypothetical protein [Pyrinomonadaceae bacterium]
MSKYTFEQYKRIFEGAVKKYEGMEFFAGLIEKFGRPAFPSEPGDIAIIGIRHEGKEIAFRENEADDIIALIRVDEAGQPKGYEYVGTTESGLFKKVYNPQGDFKMSPGFYFFRHGKHGKRQIPCLVQASQVMGERAKKGMPYNETDDKVWHDTEGTIHLHAGIPGKNVADYSAGCTVIAGDWGGAPWKQFYGFCTKTKLKIIPYVLVNEMDIPQFLAEGNGSGGTATIASPAAPEPPKPAPEKTLVLTAKGGTMRFDRNGFWEQYRQGLKHFGERVQEEEGPHVTNILDRAELDARIRDISQLAYMLTTARWETDRYRALYERGSDAYLSQYQGKLGNTKPGDYKRYRGTGYVHLTGRSNFRDAGRRLGVDIEGNPALAADLHWAYEIMVRGHLEGWFTKWKLGDFVGDGKNDFRNARRVINPGELDKADLGLRKSTRTKREIQCIEALDTQVKWAGMIEKCLASTLVDAQITDTPHPDDDDDVDNDEELGRELKLEPEPTGEGASVASLQTTSDSGTQSVTPIETSQTTSDEASAPTKKGGFLQASVGSVKRMNAAILGGVAAVIAGIKGFIEQNQTLSVIIILVTMGAVIWLVTWYIHVQRDLDKKRMEMAADPSKNNVR